MAPAQIFEAAFAQRPDLKQRIEDSVSKASELRSLFYDIADYIQEIRNSGGPDTEGKDAEPQSKKRKLEHKPQPSAAWDEGVRSLAAEISFSIPLRKKLTLELNQSVGIRAVNLTGGATSEELAVTWHSVSSIFCLPVPDKAQAQSNYAILSQSADGSAIDQVLWTVPDAAPKDGVISGTKTPQQSDTYKSFLTSFLNSALKPHRKHVIEPNAQDFSSQITQPHRKSETAYHVKAFRGSKDGYLFFLSNGIFWGFKKPLEFFAFDAIESVSYTSVLQRTFNLNIAVRHDNKGAEIQEFEFSMIDQVDFGGIDDYVKRHQLQDASMAEQRQAKKLNVNGIKGKEEDEKGDAGEGELQKAAREAQDLEDEEEEDDENFDPGSEGESEGSGSGSEEEDDDDDESGQDGAPGEEELGSEAEDADD